MHCPLGVLRLALPTPPDLATLVLLPTAPPHTAACSDYRPSKLDPAQQSSSMAYYWSCIWKEVNNLKSLRKMQTYHKHGTTASIIYPLLSSAFTFFFSGISGPSPSSSVSTIRLLFFFLSSGAIFYILGFPLALSRFPSLLHSYLLSSLCSLPLLLAFLMFKLLPCSLFLVF